MVAKKRKRKKRSHNGAIRLLKNGKYFARVSLGYTGKRYIYKTVTGNSKAEVQVLILAEKRKYRSWDITEESMMPLISWLYYWLEEIKKPMLGKTTYGNYKSFIEKHITPLIGAKKLIYITREDIIKFVEDLQYGYRSNKKNKRIKFLAYSSVSEIYGVLAAAMKSATGSGYIPENPCIRIKSPRKTKKDVPILISEDINKFLKAVERDAFWYPLFYLELMTGLRRGELCGLKVNDFNEKTGELHFHRSIKYYHQELIQTPTKTNAGRRTIVLSSSVIKILSKRKQATSSEWFFASFTDIAIPINPSSITKKLKSIFKEINIEYIRFHNLRHTFATQAISNGVEPETLAVLMGHADPVYLLNTYTHSTKDLELASSKYMTILLDNILEY